MCNRTNYLLHLALIAISPTNLQMFCAKSSRLIKNIYRTATHIHNWYPMISIMPVFTHFQFGIGYHSQIYIVDRYGTGTKGPAIIIEKLLA